MKRWLLNIAAGGSLLLGLVTIILWVRSEWVTDYLSYHPDVTETYRLDVYVISGPGGIVFGRKIFFWTPQGKAGGLKIVAQTRRLHRWEYSVNSYSPSPLGDQFRWFNWWSAIDTKMAPGTTSKEARLRIPYWFLLPLSSLLPMLWFVRFKRQRRRALVGYCLQCGYDLRTTPGSMSGMWNDSVKERNRFDLTDFTAESK